MKTIRCIIAAAALTLGATTADAQFGAPSTRDATRPGLADSARALDARNPIAMLLEHSGDLALTRDQTNRIAAIKQRLNARQRPLVAELDSLRSPSPAPRGVVPSSTPPADPPGRPHRSPAQAMADVRALFQAARADAWALLTADQRTKADSLEAKLGRKARSR